MMATHVRGLGIRQIFIDEAAGLGAELDRLTPQFDMLMDAANPIVWGTEHKPFLEAVKNEDGVWEVVYYQFRR